MRKALLTLYRRGKTSMAFSNSRHHHHHLNNSRPPPPPQQQQQQQQQQHPSRLPQQTLFTGFTGQTGSYGSSSVGGGPDEPQFDVFEWYPHYQSCTRYFLDHAQHSGPVQAAAAFLNISLPFQRHQNPVVGSSPGPSSPHGVTGPPLSGLGPPPQLGSIPPRTSASNWVSLVPYLRRLVATGFDFPGMLHGWFGDDWAAGVGPLHEQERRNYLFAAKSGGWAAVKHDYDMLPDETVPFLRPLQSPGNGEIEAAEIKWSEWLAMEDWMVGSRAPDSMEDEAPSSTRGKSTR
ncbi:MAG: hypothetical protein M1840_006058 [Geoglossum simile]|nr:MAG: hypothetical protein M1840_006058 [Geoglossum simile]